MLELKAHLTTEIPFINFVIFLSLTKLCLGLMFDKIMLRIWKHEINLADT